MIPISLKIAYTLFVCLAAPSVVRSNLWVVATLRRAAFIRRPAACAH
jgi:hypothetical protein